MFNIVLIWTINMPQYPKACICICREAWAFIHVTSIQTFKHCYNYPMNVIFSLCWIVQILSRFFPWMVSSVFIYMLILTQFLPKLLVTFVNNWDFNCIQTCSIIVWTWESFPRSKSLKLYFTISMQIWPKFNGCLT